MSNKNLPDCKNLPDGVGFVWVLRSSTDAPTLAYFTGVKFQDAYSVGDYEGLRVEYFDDVTCWAEVVCPEPDKFTEVS